MEDAPPASASDMTRAGIVSTWPKTKPIRAAGAAVTFVDAEPGARKLSNFIDHD